VFSNILYTCEKVAFIDICGSLINLFTLNFFFAGGGGVIWLFFLIENIVTAFVDLGYNVVLSASISSHGT
jgi:hypothetical protein